MQAWTAGTFAQAPVLQCPASTITRISVEQNGGTEWTAGTINFKLYTGGNVIWESGALSRTDMPETSGLTTLTDQRTLWFEGLYIPLSQDTVLRAQFETVGVAGGPEGQAINIWGVTDV